MPFLRTSIDERNEHVSIETELGAEWKFQTGPAIALELLHADLSQTFGNLSLSASAGQPTIFADLSKSLGLLSGSFSGATDTAASLSKIYGALSFSATGTSATFANLSKTLGSLTLLASENMGVLSQVSGSNFSTGSTSMVNITGLTFAASANTKYEVDVLLIGQSSTTAGVKFCIQFSAAGATGDFLLVAPGGGGPFSPERNGLGFSQATARWTTATTDSPCWMKTIVNVGANAGNITVQIQKESNGTATVNVGSRMIVTTLT
jgi:hypothetical protein